jgi:hypothetical protein
MLFFFNIDNSSIEDYVLTLLIHLTTIMGL